MVAWFIHVKWVKMYKYHTHKKCGTHTLKKTTRSLLKEADAKSIAAYF